MSEPKKVRTRERMLASAADLLSTTGSGGVTIDRVLRESGAPRGSVYHHFPDGRAEMVTGAVALASEAMISMLTAVAEQATPQECLDYLVAFWKNRLETSDFTLGCPIVGATIDDGSVPGLHELVAGTFDQWHRLIAESLTGSGVAEARARTLATVIMAATEGAIVLSRAAGSTAPLDDVNLELRQSLDAAVAAA
ncbi:TetR/AcrR family transcriptional regulator [Gordonia sp. VNK21]|uniref:TetR/AcrR family transcriptional regulator n=1 Tax=Gordonia sp. VNK21 TaxID=3382483 RepID=UPI0038D3B623